MGAVKDGRIWVAFVGRFELDALLRPMKSTGPATEVAHVATILMRRSAVRPSVVASSATGRPGLKPFDI